MTLGFNALDELASDIATDLLVDGLESVIIPLENYGLEPTPTILAGLKARGVVAKFVTTFAGVCVEADQSSIMKKM